MERPVAISAAPAAPPARAATPARRLPLSTAKPWVGSRQARPRGALRRLAAPRARSGTVARAPSPAAAAAAPRPAVAVAVSTVAAAAQPHVRPVPRRGPAGGGGGLSLVPTGGSLGAASGPAQVAISYTVDTVPVDKGECKDGGWRDHGFSSQGACNKAVKDGKKGKP